MSVHKSVQLEHVIDYLSPLEGEIVVDATAGEGGHTKALAEKVGGSGIVIALEKDPVYFHKLEETVRNYKNVRIFNCDYIEISTVLTRLSIEKAGRILFDFGISTFHIEDSGRGFSFKREEPLDMRFNPEAGKPLSYYINRMSPKEITEILVKYGEVKYASKVAQGIVARRKKSKFKTTYDLNDVIAEIFKGPLYKNELPKIYMAFRIFVNDELRHVVKGAVGGIKILKPGGKIAFISYHSLEDRIIKRLKMLSCITPLTGKPIEPDTQEVEINPRARSSKLRVYVKKEECDEEELHNCLSAFTSSFPRSLLK